MNKSSLGAFGIPESMPPDGGGTFIVNLPAPTSERTTMNERNPGAFGISELMPPVGGGLHSKESAKIALIIKYPGGMQHEKVEKISIDRDSRYAFPVLYFTGRSVVSGHERMVVW